MDYRIYPCSGGEPLDTLELHVLARAYHAAWHAMFACDPVGAHPIDALGVLLVFAAEDRPCTLRH